jgi:ubiquinone/menaquinone biosynthesis C-methylase UbiE
MTAINEALFTGKTIQYDRLRPLYPKSLISVYDKYIRNNSTIADIGAGTGYLAIPLSNLGHKIHAIEPNLDMREALHSKIQDQNIITHDAKAQRTGLESESVDSIVLGNVAHWLDGNEERNRDCLKEFSRILKKDGTIAVFSLCPSIKNPWLSDIFNLAQQYDPSFDIMKASRTFGNHKFHVDNFLSAITGGAENNFCLNRDKEDFYDYMISHSFCNENMRAEILEIFDRYMIFGSINVKISSSVFVGRLKTPSNVI